MTTPSITSVNLASAEMATEGQVGQINDLLKPILRRLSKKQAQAIISSGKVLQEKFVPLISQLIALLGNTYLVTVNYSRSLQEMIAAGKYDYCSDYITPVYFPISVKSEVPTEIILVHFNRVISSEDAMEELDGLGFRAATLPELLAFGEKYSEVQRAFPIIALGSDGDGYDFIYIPYLAFWRDKRKLESHWFRDAWDNDCRFAAVRK